MENIGIRNNKQSKSLKFNMRSWKGTYIQMSIIKRNTFLNNSKKKVFWLNLVLTKTNIWLFGVE